MSVPPFDLRLPLAHAARDLSQALERGLRGAGLRLVDYEVLRLIEASPGCIQSDLATVAEVDPSTIVAVLDKLEASGCAQRLLDDGDRRRRIVCITDAGHRALRGGRRAVAEIEAAFFDPLEERERCALALLLQRLPNVNLTVSP
jgi:DNA-binding MarR family transcriptional regulator